jgi:putative membrane protein
VLVQPDIREYLAAERTLLSYSRTAIGIMGFGFLVARFSLTPPEVPTLTPQPAVAAGMSMWLGSAIIVFSVALNVLAIVDYRSTIQRLNRAHQADWRASRLATTTAVLLALMGILLAGQLLMT